MVTFLNLGKMGRLGNQMFQIASTIGVALSNNNNYSFPKWTCQHSGVDYTNFFNIKLPELRIIKPIKEINEEKFNFNQIILDSDDYLYSLKGYFQSEKYFVEYSEIIIKYFSIKPELEFLIDEKYNNILKNSCSIHIRRGDYLYQQDHHPIQDISYYEKSVDVLYGNNFKDINFLIFSDDINWAKKNINLPNMNFIEGNVNVIDMFLMSKCENNIITNSSFSWWGAWLNKNKNKKIVAPKMWFGPALSSHDTSDLIPNKWIII